MSPGSTRIIDSRKERSLVAISQAHKAAGLASPREDAAVQTVRKGIRRKLGTAPRQKTPLMPNDLRTAFNELPETLQGSRDKALLALGFAGGFRRSELVGGRTFEKTCKLERRLAVELIVPGFMLVCGFQPPSPLGIARPRRGS